MASKKNRRGVLEECAGRKSDGGKDVRETTTKLSLAEGSPGYCDYCTVCTRGGCLHELRRVSKRQVRSFFFYFFFSFPFGASKIGMARERTLDSK